MAGKRINRVVRALAAATATATGAGALVISSGAPALADSQASITFNYGGAETFTVPAGVTKVTLKVDGAGGGNGDGVSGTGGGNGGKGGEVVATLPVSGGQVLNFNIGQGGQNGTDAGDDPAGPHGGGGGNVDSSPWTPGGNGGAPDGAVAGGGGGGGAATVVTTNGTAVLVAGGGGGGGGGGSYVKYRGGDGGNAVRFDLKSQPGTVFYVGGGTSAAGNGNGYYGTGLGAGERGYAAEQGSDVGGDGGTPAGGTSGGGGGGGGGGWNPDGAGTGGHAGGIGEGGGGGGGSGTGYIDDSTATPTTFGLSDVAASGDRGANGQVLISYEAPTLIPTTLYFFSSPNPAYDNGAITLVADVASDSGVPAGTVLFANTGCQEGYPFAVLDAAGSARCTTTAAAGTYQVTATFEPYDSKYLPAQKTITITVNHATPTTLSLASSSSPSTFGEADTLTATVGWDGGVVRGVPAGTVDFKEGSTVLCADVPVVSEAAKATCPVSLGVGTHHVTATYSGDTTYGFTGSTATLDDVVNPAPTSVALTSSVGTVTVGSPVTFNATVSSNGPGNSAPAGTVQFAVDGAPFQTAVPLARDTAALTTATLSVGTHTVTASYGGDTDLTAATSTGVNVTVNPAPTTGGNGGNGGNAGNGGTGNTGGTGGNGGNAGNGGGQPTATPDLGVTIKHVGTFRSHLPAAYGLEVGNTGTASTTSPIKVKVNLPRGERYLGVLGSGWRCKASGRAVTCTISKTLAPNQHTDAALFVDVTAKANSTLHTTATVTPSDSNAHNNTASDVAQVAGAFRWLSWCRW